MMSANFYHCCRARPRLFFLRYKLGDIHSIVMICRTSHSVRRRLCCHTKSLKVMPFVDVIPTFKWQNKVILYCHGAERVPAPWNPFRRCVMS
jgi:hypothetical protein